MHRLIDLTHVIYPGTGQRKFVTETVGADTVNHNVVRGKDQWYIMTNIQMVSHIATHIEVPYHLFPEGKDLSTMPLDAFCGQAVLLDFTGLPKKTGILRETAVLAAEKAGGIQPGDIVLCNLGYASRYGTPEYTESPYFTTEALEYLADCGMKMMGVDAGGVEIPGTLQHENHSLLFSREIPLLENVAHFDQIPSPRFHVCAFPCAIAQVEAFPVRVVAFID